VSSTPIAVGTQPILGVVTPIRGSAPFLPAPARPVEIRMESGGGDNAVLEDDDADQHVMCLLPASNQDATANAEITPAAVSAIEAQPAATRYQARDTCFAHTSWADDAMGQSAAESIGPALDPAAGG